MIRKRTVFVSISVFTLLLVAGFYSFFIDGRLVNAFDWWRQKNNPYVQTIGHWKTNEPNVEIVFKENIFPANMTRAEWQEVMFSHDMHIHKNPRKCDLFGTTGNLNFLNNYDVCAYKPIGTYTSKTCAYWYIVAAKFEDEALKKSAGTRMIYMC